MADLPPAPAPRPAWGRIALIAVLILSLFGNAVALGAFWRLREIREDLVGRNTEIVTLPEDLRQDLRAALKDRREELAPALRALLQARRTLIAAMTAAPHDRAVTEAAMITFRAELDQLLAKAQVILLDRLDER